MWCNGVTAKDVLKAIATYIEENQISPTVRELCNITGIKSTATVYAKLKILEEFGYIEKLDNSPRSIKITEYGKEILGGVKWIIYRFSITKNLDK